MKWIYLRDNCPDGWVPLVNGKWLLVSPQLQKCASFPPSWLLMVKICSSDMCIVYLVVSGKNITPTSFSSQTKNLLRYTVAWNEKGANLHLQAVERYHTWQLSFALRRGGDKVHIKDILKFINYMAWWMEFHLRHSVTAKPWHNGTSLDLAPFFHNCKLWFQCHRFFNF